MLLDNVVGTIITEATNGRIHDNRFCQYAEPKSLETDLVPASIQLLTAKSDLAQGEYEDAMFEINSLAGLATGMDLRLIDSRQDSLDGRPAVTLEYVLVDVTDSDLPTIKAVETTSAIGSTTHSLSCALGPLQKLLRLHPVSYMSCSRTGVATPGFADSVRICIRFRSRAAGAAWRASFSPPQGISSQSLRVKIQIPEGTFP